MSIRLVSVLLSTLILAACASTSGGYRDYDRGYDGRHARCYDCGTVERIKVVRGERRSSGAGAVLGGIIGGVIGNQIGSGDGRRAATAVGAIGGAVAGDQIEKNQNAGPSYDLFIRMDDGERIVINQRDIGTIREGTYIELRNGKVHELR
ncbi:MAG TPA: peptidoglycan-associated outer membrane lipoprotein precursor [Xanthomonadales bacterium]|nr:peptidoglycan-associated outer membrane lipoprotein precursor [Xanthomonadales bacterium]